MTTLHTGQWGKRSLYEHDCRVPLIIADPREKNSHGSRSRALVELVDVLPTLVDLAGLLSFAVKGPPLSGISLKNIITNEGKGRAAAVTQFARCPLDLGRGRDFRSLRTSAIDNGCVFNLKFGIAFFSHSMIF